MDNTKVAIFILIVTIVAQATLVRATNNALELQCNAQLKAEREKKFHIVGGDKGWTLGVDYKCWAAAQDIRVGENIQFNYDTGKHNVVWISEKEYTECTFEQSLIDASGCGYTFWPLKYAGTFYFVSARGTDCKDGMRLQITVNP